MKKTKNIDLSADSLLATADGLLEEGDYVEAVRILNKNAVLNGNDEESYFMYAEAYDELGLYNKAIHNLFKSLDYSEKDPGECYKGLAVCFMDLGDREMSAYYYARYSRCAFPSEDDDMEDVRAFIHGEAEEPSPLKFVWPPAIADCSEAFDRGVRHAVSEDIDSAIEAFDEIPKGNSLYLPARMNIATCCLMKGDFDTAEKECLAFMEEDPENPPLLVTITLANAYIEKKQREKAEKLARKLLESNTDNREELYKIATILCALGMHKEGYERFDKMVCELEAYDCNVLLFRAMAAYNAGMGKEALDAIGLAFDLFPSSVTLLYNKTVMQGTIDKGTCVPMEYIFGIPDELSSQYMSLLFAFSAMSKTMAKKTYKSTDLVNAILMCFDIECMESNDEMQALALAIAVKIGEYDLVRDLLLERRISNEVKLDTVVALADRNVDAEYGIVLSNLICRVRFKKMKLGRKCRDAFLEAYGNIAGHFSFVDSELGLRLAPAFEAMYARMEANGLLSADIEPGTLAAAAYVLAGEKFTHLKYDEMTAVLKTTTEDVDRLCSLIGPL